MLHLSKVSVMRGGVYGAMTGGGGLDWCKKSGGKRKRSVMGRQHTEFREEEEEGDRQRGGAVGREMSSTVQLSLAQVQIHPPFLPSAAPGAVREGGWTYGGG